MQSVLLRRSGVSIRTSRYSERFIYILSHSGRSQTCPRSAQLLLGGGTESLPGTLRLVVQLVQVYTTGANIVFLGVDQALLADVAALGRSEEEIREFRDRPEGLEHLGGVLVVDDGAGAAGFEGSLGSLCRGGKKICFNLSPSRKGFSLLSRPAQTQENLTSLAPPSNVD